MANPQVLVETALQTSSADECVVIVSTSASANLRWANNTLTTNGVATGTEVTVISFVDGASGTAAAPLSRSLNSKKQAKALVADADRAAREAGAADDAAELVPGAGATDWDDAPGTTSIDVFETLAPALGSAFTRADGTRLLYGYAEHSVDTAYLGSSTGLRMRHEQPAGFFSMTGKPADLSTSAWVGQATEDFDDVDLASLDDEIVRRIGWAERRVDLDAGRYETVLPPAAVADLTIYAYWLASARDAHEGRTAYAKQGGGTKIGDRIARPSVSMRGDPTARGVATTPFVVASSSSSMASVFDNGLPIAGTDWIANGVLTNLISSRHTAGLTGVDLAPPADNLILDVDGGTGSVDDLVASTERGLLLTCLWYIREVDPQTMLLTGLTRDGVYLVEDGKVRGAVNNFRFNESPLLILDRFTEAGATVRSFSREWGDYFPRTATPPLRVPGFNMSSVSQAS